MKKPKKKYFQFPIVSNGECCPICGRTLLLSKLSVVLYDGFNQNRIDAICKIKFCNACHIPFLTKEDKERIQSEYPGFHLETMDASGSSREFLLRLTDMPALPIKNIPKETMIFVGEEGEHKCGHELVRFHGILHTKGINKAVKMSECESCKRYIVSPLQYNKMKYIFKDYIYAADSVSWSDIYPYQKTLYLLNPKQYEKETCPDCACMGRLYDAAFCFKSHKSAFLKTKKMKYCGKCGKSFGKSTTFKQEQYSLYKFSKEFYEEPQTEEDVKHIDVKTGDFLTRHNLSNCIHNKHSMEDIIARVKVVDEKGGCVSCDVPAVRCNTCQKLYLLEKEYQKIRAKGTPLCSVVEYEYWRMEGGDADGKWGSFETGGSVIYIHGYNVAAQNNLTVQQRRVILQDLIKSNVLTKAEICSHLDTLIKRAKKLPTLKNAKAKWEEDRIYVEHYGLNSDVIHADSIVHRTYKTKPGKEAGCGNTV